MKNIAHIWSTISANENRNVLYAVLGGILLISFQLIMFAEFLFTPTTHSSDLLDRAFRFSMLLGLTLFPIPLTGMVMLVISLVYSAVGVTINKTRVPSRNRLFAVIIAAIFVAFYFFVRANFGKILIGTHQMLYSDEEILRKYYH